MSLQELVEISRYYGRNPEYVIAGGGNTSWKDGNALYVKGSGTALGEIDSGGFVKMDRTALAGIWTRRYPEDTDAREAAVLSDMMAARAPGEEGKRPSVETLLHDILPFLYVVHTHPALVNGVTCSQEGEAAVRRLFGRRGDVPPIWIPVINPGYVLSAAVKEAMEGYIKKHGRPAEVIFLQNHGIFVGANSAAEIKALYRRVIDRIASAVGPAGASPGNGIRGECGGVPLRGREGSSGAILAGLKAALLPHYGDGLFIRFDRNNEIARLVQDRLSFAAVSSAFTPDHIVYAGSDPLFIEGPQGLSSDALSGAVERHIAKTGRPPKIIAAQGIGVYSVGSHQKAADLAFALFQDAMTVAAYTEAFGGPRFMPQENINFINNWEVERYRSSVSVKE